MSVFSVNEFSSHDADWLSARVVVDPGRICLDTLTPNILTRRKINRDLLTNGLALVAVIFAMLLLVGGTL